jgi:prepilin-type N-terminal cleavage/methylation domain-containing protein
MRRIGTKLGFTLVELLMVAALAGVVLKVAVPQLLNARKRSEYETCLTNLRIIELAKTKLSKHRKLSHSYVVKDAKDLVSKYMDAWPSGPVVGSYSATRLGEPATFRDHGTKWFIAHCGNDHYDGECPF